MDWLFRLMVLWFGLSLVIVATAWYASVLIPQLCPSWWRKVVVDIEPDTQFNSKR